MKQLFTFFLFANCQLLIADCCFAQPTKYWIQFTDRNNTPYSISNPSQYLSARAIQRRANQSIPVVQNDLPVNANYIDSVASVPNVTVLNREKWFNAITIQTSDTNAVNTILAFPFVKKTQAVQRHIKTNDELRMTNYELDNRNNKFPFYHPVIQPSNHPVIEPSNHPAIQSSNLPILQSSSSYNYGLSFNQVNMLGGVCMHNMGFDGKGVVIAILDVGFQHYDSAAAFDSIRANKQVLGYWNFVNRDSSFYSVAGDVHGAWCLSLMAGNIPGQLVGTAPKAKYWLLVTEYGPSENIIEEDNWVSGAEFADSAGADVLSTSLGYTQFDDSTVNHTYADMNGHTARISIASAIAASKGMVPVCAAGNSGWSPWHFIGAPADADSTLAVGAVDSMSNYVGFSSKGPSYDGRVKPNVAAQGDHPYTTDLAGGTYNSFSGTSFACPLTAGMTACLWQAHTAKTSMEIYNAIQQSASHYTTPDTLTGYGIPDFCKAHQILTSVPENFSDENIFVFPNPSADGRFTVQSSGLNVQGLEIYNVLGEKVTRSVIPNTVRNLTIDISNQPGGVYVLKAIAGNKNYLLKLVKY
ncbi:MAG: S8 family peptidase [Bacteroidetes bacterium]|nr:S8 family peptidase [Bacteroidota bacterium]